MRHDAFDPKFYLVEKYRLDIRVGLKREFIDTIDRVKRFRHYFSNEVRPSKRVSKKKLTEYCIKKMLLILG